MEEAIDCEPNRGRRDDTEGVCRAAVHSFQGRRRRAPSRPGERRPRGRFTRWSPRGRLGGGPHAQGGGTGSGASASVRAQTTSTGASQGGGQESRRGDEHTSGDDQPAGFDRRGRQGDAREARETASGGRRGWKSGGDR